MNVELWTEAFAQFLFWEYINGFFVAVWSSRLLEWLRLWYVILHDNMVPNKVQDPPKTGQVVSMLLRSSLNYEF
jgi:hypothetical protein